MLFMSASSVQERTKNSDLITLYFFFLVVSYVCRPIFSVKLFDSSQPGVDVDHMSVADADQIMCMISWHLVCATLSTRSIMENAIYCYCLQNRSTFIRSSIARENIEWFIFQLESVIAANLLLLLLSHNAKKRGRKQNTTDVIYAKKTNSKLEKREKCKNCGWNESEKKPRYGEHDDYDKSGA